MFLIQQRHKGMEDVRSIMSDVADLSETTAQEVDRQDNLVIAIEQNVDGVNENVVAANVELSQATGRKERQSTRIICILLVLFLVLASWVFAAFGNPFTSSDSVTTQMNEFKISEAIKKAIKMTMQLPATKSYDKVASDDHKLDSTGFLQVNEPSYTGSFYSDHESQAESIKSVEPELVSTPAFNVTTTVISVAQPE